MSINVSDVTKALQNQLQTNENVSEFLCVPVERGEYINEDPNRTPWVGVYRSKSRYDTRTLGVTAANWEVHSEIRIVVQDTDLGSAEVCEDLLEEHIQLVIDAVFADTTIGGTVSMVNDVSIEYLYNETDRETLYFQTAVITISLEVKTA